MVNRYLGKTQSGDCAVSFVGVVAVYSLQRGQLFSVVSRNIVSSVLHA